MFLMRLFGYHLKLNDNLTGRISKIYFNFVVLSAVLICSFSLHYMIFDSKKVEEFAINLTTFLSLFEAFLKLIIFKLKKHQFLELVHLTSKVIESEKLWKVQNYNQTAKWGIKLLRTYLIAGIFSSSSYVMKELIHYFSDHKKVFPLKLR